MTMNEVVKNDVTNTVSCPEKNIAYFMKSMADIIQSDIINELSATRRSDFTRPYRKLSPKDLLMMMIFRKGKTLQSDIFDYLGCGWASDDMPPSKQAYHAGLKKLNPAVFNYLFRCFAEEFYRCESAVKLLREKYLVVAEDGTFVQIAKSYQNILYYGFYPGFNCSNIFEVKKIIAKAGALYDVNNGFFIDFQIRNATTSELPLAHMQIERLHRIIHSSHKNVIYLADRYYGSIELFLRLQMHGMDYCIRAKKNFYKDLVASVLEEGNDGWIEIELTDAIIKRLKYEDIRSYARKKKVLRLRVVKNFYEYATKNGRHSAIEALYFTSLSQEEFTHDEIVSLYMTRWNCETGFRNAKILHEMERTNSIFRNINESRIYSRILSFNFAGILKKEADYQLRSKKTVKYDCHISKHVVIWQTIQETEFIKALVTGDEKNLIRSIEFILRTAVRCSIPVRKGRHEKRYGRFILGRFHYRFTRDGRNYPKTKNYKNGMITVSR